MTTALLRETASQTAGPYVHIGLAPQAAGIHVFERHVGAVVAAPDMPGERIRIEGRVLDGAGRPVHDALLEIWQADAAGHALPPAAAQVPFRGWGRAASDFDTGVYRFDTLKPGAVRDRNGRPLAPYVSWWIVARGINLGLHTRMYFSDEAAANAHDPVLALIDPARRQTLVAERAPHADGPVYRFDIRLQGEGETVFFDI